MKKLLLIVGAVTLTVSQTLAQCTPGANYADSTFGAWPDTTQNFPAATVDVAYSTDLNFKVPADAGDVDPTYAGYTIEDFSVDNVTGLPTGFAYACNVAGCTYMGGQNGCAQITGTCSTPGTYNITIEVTANVDPGLGFTIPVPYTFTGYKIEVLPAVGVVMIDASNVKFYPNPANDQLTIEGLLGIEKVEIYTMNGALMQSTTVIDETMKLNVEVLQTGMYFIHMVNAQGVLTQKFMKK